MRTSLEKGPSNEFVTDYKFQPHYWKIKVHILTSKMGLHLEQNFAPPLVSNNFSAPYDVITLHSQTKHYV